MSMDAPPPPPYYPSPSRIRCGGNPSIFGNTDCDVHMRIMPCNASCGIARTAANACLHIDRSFYLIHLACLTTSCALVSDEPDGGLLSITTHNEYVTVLAKVHDNPMMHHANLAYLNSQCSRQLRFQDPDPVLNVDITRVYSVPDDTYNVIAYPPPFPPPSPPPYPPRYPPAGPGESYDVVLETSLTIDIDIATLDRTTLLDRITAYLSLKANRVLFVSVIPGSVIVSITIQASRGIVPELELAWSDSVALSSAIQYTVTATAPLTEQIHARLVLVDAPLPPPPIPPSMPPSHPHASGDGGDGDGLENAGETKQSTRSTRGILCSHGANDVFNNRNFFTDGVLELLPLFFVCTLSTVCWVQSWSFL